MITAQDTATPITAENVGTVAALAAELATVNAVIAMLNPAPTTLTMSLSTPTLAAQTLTFTPSAPFLSALQTAASSAQSILQGLLAGYGITN